ncbi:MAG: peroxidase [Caulobacteraceae bacterium]|nr:peroxidase [Caulobacteraceae bacterium]
MPPPVTELDDIQALLKGGFGDLTEAVFLLLTITDPDGARAWLAGARVTSVADMREHLTSAMQVAVTAAGLAALGLDAAALAGFSAEFVTGMSGDEARARRLGDVGANAPAGWDWGGARGDPHLLVMLYAAPGDLGALRDKVETADFRSAFTVLALPTIDMKGREPFGFVDGVSQSVLDWAGARTPGTAADCDYGNLIAAGEFLLGYPNEYGRLTRRPLLEPAHDPGNILPAAADDPTRRDLGRNGSYLVLRQLSQDVRGFWRWVRSQEPRGSADALAEAMVGRGLSGEALIATGGRALRGVGPKADDLRLNGFTYDGDPRGLACPFGGHVRRANPRTGDMPGGVGNWLTRQLRRLGLDRQDPRADVVAASRFHRILRRGREYGRFIEPAQAADPAADDPAGGLHFICLAANIARQFEFIQGAWLMSAKFGGLTGEQDPLLGNRLPFPPGVATDGFSIPQAAGAARKVAPLPQFVTVRGDAYFFLPGLRALRFIARGAISGERDSTRLTQDGETTHWQVSSLAAGGDVLL